MKVIYYILFFMGLGLYAQKTDGFYESKEKTILYQKHL